MSKEVESKAGHEVEVKLTVGLEKDRSSVAIVFELDAGEGKQTRVKLNYTQRQAAELAMTIVKCAGGALEEPELAAPSVKLLKLK